MKRPFWIANLGLLSLLLATFALVYFSRIKIPERSSIELAPLASRKERKVVINIKKIYENDLFGTYTKELPHAKQVEITPLPEPPPVQKITAPKISEPEFLPPLNITLKGIIVVGTNDAKNRTIIQDNVTSQEATYKIGDTIQDAQLIRIFKNKIILLRSVNGQQEVLYLREQDAKTDPVYALLDGWESIIKKTGDVTFLIDPTLFVDRIKNLAQLIDLLNITTAYQKGKSIGLRIGQAATASLGSALGLQTGDIITQINQKPVNTTDERLTVYKKVVTLKLNDSITVTLIRKGTTITLTYTLEAFSLEKKTQEAQTQGSSPVITSEKYETIKQQHQAFVPTVDKMRKADRRMMVEQSKSPVRGRT